MKLREGTQVVILASGETGVLLHYDGRTAFIDVDGVTVQEHESAIEPVDTFGVSEKNVPNKNAPVPAGPDGIWLELKGIHDSSGEWLRFDQSLINNTDTDLLIEFEYVLDEIVQHKTRRTINAGERMELNAFKTDHLNDAPVWRFNFWQREKNAEKKHFFSKEIRLKAKQFFSRIESPEFIAQGFFLLQVSDEIPAAAVREIKEKPDLNFPQQKRKVDREHPVVMKASLPDHIDLHMEKLMPGMKFTDNSEILRHQTRAFRDFLEKAIRFNLHKIYAVHGLGKGVLKNEIEKILNEYPEVESYNNDYHSRFGFGATEIFLSK